MMSRIVLSYLGVSMTTSMHNIHINVHAVLMYVTRQIKPREYPFECNFYKYLVLLCISKENLNQQYQTS